MRTQGIDADVVIVGAGAAGSLLALALGRRGIACAVVDLHERYPVDFRCEKFSPRQAAGLTTLGVADALETLTSEGASLTDEGFRYDRLVNALRGAWPAEVSLIQGKADRLETGTERQAVILADGRRIEGRLVVVATGPMSKLAEPLGVTRRTLRRRHSMCVGFSIAPARADGPALPALVHPGERAGDGMGFASLFPMDGTTRVNLFAYRDPTSPWARAALTDPQAALFEAMPGLRRRLGDVRVVGPVETRATDLYQAEGHVQDGVVLIGDAFRSSCPATGMGMTRIIGDVTRLADHYIFAWLAGPDMGADKIAAFYADAAKIADDAESDRRSETGRRTATETSLPWRARRGLAQLKRAVAAGAA